MSYTVLNTQADLTEEAKAYLQKNGCTIRFEPLAYGLSEDEICQELRGADAVLAGNEGYTEKVFEAGEWLRIVARVGVGYDNVDLAAATRHGVWVTNTPGATTPGVAEFTIGLMLCLLRHIPAMVHDMQRGRWNRQRGRELGSLTVGVIGAGSIGKEVIKLARAFGSEVLAYDVVQDDEFARAYRIRYVSLDQLMAESDIITIHCSLNQDTRGLIDAPRLGLTKKGACLVNTARASIVDKAALIETLESGQLAGAALDVHDPAPCSLDDALARLDSVIATPWTAANTDGVCVRASIMATRDVVRVLKGGVPEFALNEA